jgi:predicted enzyme related to lactoylglutathione lyase
MTEKMKKTNKTDDGLFTWIEFTTTKTSTSLPFFKKIFHYTHDEKEDAPYIQFKTKTGAHHIGGFCEPKEGGPLKPQRTLNVYIASSDVRGITKVISENGGKVLKEPFDVMDKGTMGVYLDPQGAEFNVWQSKTHGGMDVEEENGGKRKKMMVHGFPCWYELNAKDTDAARRFYGDVFGWTWHIMNGEGFEYTVFHKGDEQVCGMIKMTSEWGDTAPHWITYFHVDDIDESCKVVKESGGNVCVPPTEIKGRFEKFAMVNDPTGLTFSVMSEMKLDKDQWMMNFFNISEELSRTKVKLERYRQKFEKVKELVLEEEDQSKSQKRKLSHAEAEEKEIKKKKIELIKTNKMECTCKMFYFKI